MSPEYTCPQCGQKNGRHKMDCSDPNRACTEEIREDLLKCRSIATKLGVRSRDAANLAAGASLMLRQYMDTGYIDKGDILQWVTRAMAVSR